MRLIGQGDGPVFVFTLGEFTLDIHFQGAPDALLRRSLYRQFMTRALLSPGMRRPDIAIRVSEDGVTRRIVLIEAKCSVALDTIRDGGFQLLGYLSDFKLYEEAETILMVVAYGGVQRYPSAPFLKSGRQRSGAGCVAGAGGAPRPRAWRGRLIVW